MKISVALCTYNGEKYIRAQLESIIRQSCLPDEIIICDDKSSDNTVLIINSIISENEHICIKLFLNDENIGYIKNFEKCISLCTGDIIFLCDQDDLWTKEKVLTIKDKFEKNHNLALVFTDAQLIKDDGQIMNKKLWDVYKCDENDIREFKTKEAYKKFLERNYSTGATMAFKRSFLEKKFVVPEGWVHDHYIGFMMACSGEIEACRLCLTQYRIHDGQEIGISAGLMFNRVKNRLRAKNVVGNELNRTEAVLEKEFLTLEQREFVKKQVDFLALRAEIRKQWFLKRFCSVMKNFREYYGKKRWFFKMSVDILNV